jgi:hypothetical protein
VPEELPLQAVHLLDGYPKVTAMMAKLMALPEVVAYYQKHLPAAA